MAAAAVALSPMFLGLTSTLNTTAFEPFAWTYIAYAVARAIVRHEQRFLVKAGLVAGLALEAKYAVPLFLVPLIVGAALGPSRHVLFTRHAAIGAAACTARAAQRDLAGRAQPALPRASTCGLARQECRRITGCSSR
jgi:4-amino-4-deoxy-L-arabinose transferase-like glycosyltransferase